MCNLTISHILPEAQFRSVQDFYPSGLVSMITKFVLHIFFLIPYQSTASQERSGFFPKERDCSGVHASLLCHVTANHSNPELQSMLCL